MTDACLPDVASRLEAEVAALRARGGSPKEIARALGVRPSVVVPVLRRLAALQAAGEAADQAAGRSLPALVSCKVNQGWADELDVLGDPGWPRGAGSNGSAGLATVLVARRAQGMRVSVCIYLLDTHCLGVKSVIGPRTMTRDQLARLSRQSFEPYGAPPLDAPIELARHLVLGAVAFARRLGFEPPDDYPPCVGHLGTLEGEPAIRFGRHGTPFYVQGPYDDPARVLRTLDRTVGPDRYHFLLAAPA